MRMYLAEDVALPLMLDREEFLQAFTFEKEWMLIRNERIDLFRTRSEVEHLFNENYSIEFVRSLSTGDPFHESPLGYDGLFVGPFYARYLVKPLL